MIKFLIPFLLLPLAGFTIATVELLEFSDTQAKTAQEIISKLSKHHYQKLTIDDQFSIDAFNNYIDSLDSLKSYFLQSDIDDFSPYKRSIDDALLAADLSPGFAIYNRFRKRMDERLAANIALLKSDFEFDFTKKETLSLDKEQRQWSITRAVADDHWRKRVKDSLLRLLLSGKDQQAAKDLLIKRYETQLSQLSQQDNEDVFQFFINALTGLYDPHTSYMSPRTLENFNISMSLSLEGIGAVLQRQDEFTKIVRLVPGGPADTSTDLRVGDKIVAVGQGKDGEVTDVVGWRLDEVVALIRGKKDTLVRLEIISGSMETSDKTEIVTIVRDKVSLEEQAAKSEIIEIQDGESQMKVGVIKIPAFYMDFEAYRKRDPHFKSSTRDVQNLLIQLRTESVDGIILDLRNNGGGSLLEAITLTDLFIDPGPIVQIRHSDQRISRDQRSRRRPFYKGPLVVLVNRLSASASEIFAGAIQDYGRGLILGGPSFGKGTVQIMSPLMRGQLKFTESKFYRVSGDSTQHRGIIPDIEFPSYYNHEDVGESSQLRALPWDSIHSVNHKVYNKLASVLSELKLRHDSRVINEPDWQFMLDEIALIKQQRQQKELSLNRNVREKLQKERESYVLKIENKRRVSRSLAPFPTYAAYDEHSKESLDDEETPDPSLREASMLLLDFIDISTHQSPPRIVIDNTTAVGSY